MAKALSTIKAAAEVVRDETNIGANTAARVGGLFVDVVNYLANVSAVKVIGALDSVADLPATANIGDGYYVGDDLYVYVGENGNYINPKWTEIQSMQGLAGEDGVGIQSITTAESNVSGGTNVVTITLSDNTSTSFNVKNGIAGAAFEWAEDTSGQNSWDTTKSYIVPSGTPNVLNIYYYENNAWNLSNETITTSITIVNNLTSGGTAVALSAEMGKQLNEMITDRFVFEDEYEINVSDANGNVILRVDDDGTETTNVKAKQIQHDGNLLLVSDYNGNLIFKISKNGVETTKVVADDFKTSDGENVSGKYKNFSLYTVGDSFCAGNYWNVKCAEILGCEFDAEANTRAGQNISTGGTSTYGGKLDSAFFRVKNLYDQNIVENDGENAIILLENVNDISHGVTGTINDVPLIPKTPIQTGEDVDNFSAATLAAIDNSLRELSACLTLLKSTNGTRLTITAVPTIEGDVTIMTGWGGVGQQYYGIHVIPQATEEETMDYVLARILEINYTGVTAIDGGDGQSVIFSAGVSSPYYTFLSFTDTDSTGMTCTLSATDSVPASIEVTRFFIGDDVSDWEDTTKWTTGTYLNMYRAWKSCIEYLMDKFPKAQVMLTGFPSLKFEHDDYLRADGTRDTETFYASDIATRNRTFFAFLKDLAAYYNIPYIGVGEECGINVVNISTFYPNNNVHPNHDGFDRMARFVAKEIEKYV